MISDMIDKIQTICTKCTIEYCQFNSLILQFFNTLYSSALFHFFHKPFLQHFDSSTFHFFNISLDMRRTRLCLKFAKNCLRNEKMKKLFPNTSKHHKMNTRSQEKFKVNKAYSERYRKSAVPYMQNLLNQEAKKIKQILAWQSLLPANFTFCHIAEKNKISLSLSLSFMSAMMLPRAELRCGPYIVSLSWCVV